MTVRRAGLIALLLVVSLSGCAVFHRNALAPGHIDVNVAPSGKYRTWSDFRDPGEDVTLLGYGVWGGTGVGSSGTTAAFGPELSLQIGRTPETHYSDREELVRPMIGGGVNLGFTTNTMERRRPLYLEGQVNGGYLWAAGGLTWDAWRHQTGWQMGGGLGPLFVRYAGFARDEGFFLFGLVIKGGLAWVRSR